MSSQPANAHWVIWLSLLAAALLSLLPLPSWLAMIRPAWVPLAVIYWALALPDRFGLFCAFITGLLLDVLVGTLFGLHALGLTLITFIIHNMRRRLRLFPWWQQAFVILCVLAGYQLLLLWVRAATGYAPTLGYLLPALTSAALWPWLLSGLQRLQHSFQVT